MLSWFCALFGHDCAYDPMRLACTSGSIRLVGCVSFGTNDAFNVVLNVSLIILNFQNLNIPLNWIWGFLYFLEEYYPYLLASIFSGSSSPSVVPVLLGLLLVFRTGSISW